MIVELKDNKNINKVGNKAKFLIEMKRQGFNVPNGIVIDSDTYKEEIDNNKISSKITKYLKEINDKNIETISKKIIKLFDSFKFSKEVEQNIKEKLNKKKLYAVRSSGTKEDLEEYSFAGQYKTFLNVDYNNVLDKVVNCYKSMFSEIILSYFYILLDQVLHNYLLNSLN